jgi:antitoxin (DNA-binding transcriptional repressor) of toxin-antitoxin stability system
MQTAAIEDVQARLPEFIDSLGPGVQIIITRDGKPVAGLTEVPKGVPIPGRGKGMVHFHAEDDSHLEEFKEYM